MGRRGKTHHQLALSCSPRTVQTLPTGHYKVKLCQARLREVRRAVTREAEVSAVLSSSSGAALLLFATAAPDKQRESPPKYPVTSDHAVPPEGPPPVSPGPPQTRPASGQHLPGPF